MFFFLYSLAGGLCNLLAVVFPISRMFKQQTDAGLCCHPFVFLKTHTQETGPNIFFGWF